MYRTLIALLVLLGLGNAATTVVLQNNDGYSGCVDSWASKTMGRGNGGEDSLYLKHQEDC